MQRVDKVFSTEDDTDFPAHSSNFVHRNVGVRGNRDPSSASSHGVGKSQTDGASLARPWTRCQHEVSSVRSGCSLLRREFVEGRRECRISVSDHRRT